MDERRALKQQETKDHQERMKAAAEAAARLRAALRAFWGFSNPILLKYGIHPNTGGKPPKEPVTETPEQPQTETPASAAPESQPAPQGTEPAKSEGPAPQTEPRSS